MNQNEFWQVVLCIVLVTKSTYCFNCTDVDKKKCYCFQAENVNIQCPMLDPDLGMSIAKHKKVTLQCLKDLNPYIDFDIVPQLDLSGTSTFRMQYCYLNSSFHSILERFNIRELKSLSFESMSSRSVDVKMPLTKESFEDMDSLEDLRLSYSAFNFSEDFLVNTRNLKILILSNNDIGELKDYFKYVPKLKILEVSQNQVNILPDGIFADLSNLTGLNMYNNNISSVSRKLFHGLISLKLLELSNNRIEDLPEDTLADLNNLVNISLTSNRIKHLHSNTFKNNPFLKNIRFGNNPNVTLSDFAFANLGELISVELFNNLIVSIPEHTFQNCNKLHEITLRDNMLKSLPENLFKGLENLVQLDLSRNKLDNLANELFSSLKNLEILNLSNNQLKNIDQYLFRNLYSLEKLQLHSNMISAIHIRAFTGPQQSLTFLDLSFNKWNNSYEFPQFDVVISPLYNLIKLEELILSHNELVEIPSPSTFLYLKNLDLSFNQIEELQVHHFARYNKFTLQVDLSSNKIELVNFIGAEYLSKKNNIHEGLGSVLKLKNNPIVCNCSVYDLVLYNHHQMPDLMDLVQIVQDGLTCANDNNTLVKDLWPDDIGCPLELGCPEPCDCTFKPYGTAIIVDCSHKNLTSFPVLDGQMGRYAYNQTYLVLQGNSLTRGPSFDMDHYGNVTSLDLSKNRITEVHWIPQQVKELDLSNNLIKNMNVEFINKLKNATALERLYLKGNPWECSCRSLDLQKYLMQYYHKVNSSDVFCHNIDVQLVKYTDICKISPYVSILLPILLSILLLLAVAVALYYRYQLQIKIYLFSKNMCLWLVTEEELDKDKTYDVFISYAHQDEKFVVESLLPELEQGEKQYKVCIHIRDFIPGEFISHQVVNSVKESRRTLVVLSNNFVDSVWGKLEFRTAHTEAISEGRARVIVVVYGDLDESRLDEEIRSYIKTNTYVKWGDKYFWNKLKYALPHSKKFLEKNKKHAKVMLKIDDKFDLMKTPPSPTNTSTPPITLDPSLLEKQDIKINMPNKVDGEAPLLVKQ